MKMIAVVTMCEMYNVVVTTLPVD